MSMLELRGIALIALLAPSTNSMLKMFDPITLPMTIWFSPFLKAVSEVTSSGKEVDVSGVLGVMFDRDALGVTNLDRRVTTNYNAKAEFFNNYYKFDAGYFNDTNENFVVFFIA